MTTKERLAAEEIARKLVDGFEYMDTNTRQLKAEIEEALLQAKKEAYEEGFNRGVLKCLEILRGPTYTDCLEEEFTKLFRQIRGNE